VLWQDLLPHISLLLLHSVPLVELPLQLELLLVKRLG
jgi:hypothetical protein